MSRSSGLIISGGGGGGSTIITQEDDVQVNAAADTIDFMSGFDLANNPGTRTKINLDLSEYGGAALPIAGGGTGQTSQTPAFDALSPLTTQGDLITHDGADNVRLPVGNIYEVVGTDGTDPLWVPRPRQLVTQEFFSVANVAGTASLLSTGAIANLIPANTLAVGDTIRLTAGGFWTNTTGAGATIFIYCLWGANQVNLTLSTLNTATGATNRPWWVDATFSVFALGNAATGTWTWSVSSDVAANNAALWVVANSVLTNNAFLIDTTANIGFDFRVSSTANSANQVNNLYTLAVTHIPTA